MDNGMRYPKAVITKEPAAQDSINKIIEANVADLRAQDFCAGDFGFVQKGVFVQVHMLCNCIDMEQSEHRYLFFNFKDGTQVAVSEMFDPKKRDEALKFMLKKVSEYKSSDEACNTAYASINESSTFDDIDIRLAADGIEIRPVDTDVCEHTALMIKWLDVHSFLRLNYI